MVVTSFVPAKSPELVLLYVLKRRFMGKNNEIKAKVR